MNKASLLVKAENVGARLDVFLSQKLGVSRSQAQKMIRTGAILLNVGKPKKTGERLAKGDALKAVKLESLKVKKFADSRQNDGFDIKIIAETKDYLVIEKPSGVLTHPTEAGEMATVSAWILANYPKTRGVGDYADRPGIVHRLDKEASGLIVIARTDQMFDHLKKQFQKRTVAKEYLVLVHGKMEREHGLIDFDIDRGKDGRMVSRPKTGRFSLRTVTKIQPGKEALTEYWIEKKFARFTLLRVKIHTGRSHQIRVHFLAYNHPVVGDSLYFNKKLNRKKDKELGRLFLHSAKLGFLDLNERPASFSSDLPESLKSFLQKLK